MHLLWNTIAFWLTRWDIWFYFYKSRKYWKKLYLQNVSYWSSQISRKQVNHVLKKNIHKISIRSVSKLQFGIYKFDFCLYLYLHVLAFIFWAIISNRFNFTYLLMKMHFVSTVYSGYGSPLPTSSRSSSILQ